MLRPGYLSVPFSSPLKVDRTDMPGSTSALVSRSILPAGFPATRSILWDHQDIGPPSAIHLTQCKNPLVLLDETVLRLVQRLAQDSAQNKCTVHLSGLISPEPDGSGITINIDQLDTSQGSNASRTIAVKNAVAGRITIPFVVTKDGSRPQILAEDILNALQAIETRCFDHRSVNISHFISMRAYASCLRNQSHPSSAIFQLDILLVYPGVGFRVIPVNAIPIIPTALSKNLCGPMSISDVQGEPKSGFLSMDQTRKLLLVLESDPKVSSLPTVGIWIAGLANVEDPFVWASLLRYIFTQHLKDRVCLPPEPFLIVFFSSLHSKPEFYECFTSNGSCNLEFELSCCKDVIQTYRDNLIAENGGTIEMELEAANDVNQLNVFHAALQLLRSNRISDTNQLSQKSQVSNDVEEPRTMPVKPHAAQELSIRPSVPELTLFFDSNCPSSTGQLAAINEGKQSQSAQVFTNHHSADNCNVQAAINLSGPASCNGCRCTRTDLSDAANQMAVQMQYMHGFHTAADMHPEAAAAVGTSNSCNASSDNHRVVSHSVGCCAGHQFPGNHDFIQPMRFMRETEAKMQLNTQPDLQCLENNRAANQVWAHRQQPPNVRQSAVVNNGLRYPEESKPRLQQPKITKDRFQPGAMQAEIQHQPLAMQNGCSQMPRQAIRTPPDVNRPIAMLNERSLPRLQQPVMNIQQSPQQNSHTNQFYARGVLGPGEQQMVQSAYSQDLQHVNGQFASVKHQSFARPQLQQCVQQVTMLPVGVQQVYHTAGGAPPAVAGLQQPFQEPSGSHKFVPQDQFQRNQQKREKTDQVVTGRQSSLQGQMLVSAARQAGSRRSLPGQTCYDSATSTWSDREPNSGEIRPTTQPSPQTAYCRQEMCNRVTDVVVEDQQVFATQSDDAVAGVSVRSPGDVFDMPMVRHSTGNQKADTVDSLLSAICEPVERADQNCSATSVNRLLGHYSQSTDSGLQVSSSFSQSEMIPERLMSHSRLDNNEDPSKLNVSETDAWTVRRQLESLLAGCQKSLSENFRNNDLYPDDQIQPAQQVLSVQQQTPGNMNQKQLCSVAVNTTLLWPLSNASRDNSEQTLSSQTPFRRGVRLPPSDSSRRKQEWVDVNDIDENSHGSGAVDDSFYSPPIPMFANPSEESVASEMIVDMLEYESPSPEKSVVCNESELCQMPVRDDIPTISNGSVSGTPVAESQSLKNGQGQRHKRHSYHRGSQQSGGTESLHSSCASLSSGSSRSSEQRSAASRTANRTNNLFEPSMIGVDDTVMLEAAFLPKLNYRSVQLDQTTLEEGGRSPADTTAIVNAVNAAALKYLNDQQLVHQVVATGSRQSTRKSMETEYRSLNDDGPKSNMSLYGVRSANMSMASRKYFEKHGLLSSGAKPSVGNDRSDTKGFSPAKGNMKSLLESITSQVNNIQVLDSPERTAKKHDDSCSAYDPSLYDCDNQAEESWISDSSRLHRDDDVRLAGYCQIESCSEPQRKMAADRSTFSDMSLNYVNDPEQWYTSSAESFQPHYQSFNNMVLRPVDRTLEFSDSIVVDSPVPQQLTSHR